MLNRILMLSLAVFVVACVKELPELTAQQIAIEKKYNLPPAPDAELAKSEIVDVNNNGLRDEVERGIAFALDEKGEDIVKMVSNFTKLSQQSMQPESTKYLIEKNFRRHGDLIGCLMQKYRGNGLEVREIINVIDPLLIDTEKRMEEDQRVEEMFVGFSNPIGSDHNKKLAKICPQYF